MATTVALGGLFLIAFVAATILPVQSEVALVALLVDGRIAPTILVATASLGNTLGSIVNWGLGRALGQLHNTRHIRTQAAALQKASLWYRRWGYWSLLLSWAPIIGDPLTVVAGLLGEPLWRFTLIVALAKTSRYAIISLFTLGVT